MNRDTVGRFKALFEKERQKLIYSRKIINEDFHIARDELSDEIDVTSSELETSMRLRLRNREALFLKKIEDALGRIAVGTFGQCEGCGDDIEARRLESRPTTTMCLACKEEAERKEEIHIDGRRSKSLGARVRLA